MINIIAKNKLNLPQRQLIKDLIYNLNQTLTQSNSRFTVLKYRYLELCQLDADVEDLMQQKVPIQPIAILKFSSKAMFKLKVQYVTPQQQIIIEHFIVNWQNLNKFN